MTETVNVTITQDDINEAREKGFVKKKDVMFCIGNSRFMDLDDKDYKRTVILTPSTLYRNGVAVWPSTSIDGEPHTEYRVEAEYERPPLETFLESEIRASEDQELNTDYHRDEYWLGNLHQLRNVEGWIDDD